jgi:uncharacterized membrane protein YecN with MAPEG domain
VTATALLVPITTLYAGLLALLLLVAELNHAGPALLHACGAVLVVARVLHAMGLAKSAGASWPRAAGTVGTVGVIVVLAAVDVAAFLR